MYNEWAEMGADVEEAEEEEEEDEEDEYEEGDEEEDEEDDAGPSSPPAKKSKRDSPAEQPAYAIPVATSLAAAAATVLAPHLNMTRADGETRRLQPYYGSMGEHYVVVNVVHGDDED